MSKLLPPSYVQLPLFHSPHGSGAETATSVGHVSKAGHPKARSSDDCDGGDVRVGFSMNPEIRKWPIAVSIGCMSFHGSSSGGGGGSAVGSVTFAKPILGT